VRPDFMQIIFREAKEEAKEAANDIKRIVCAGCQC